MGSEKHGIFVTQVTTGKILLPDDVTEAAVLEQLNHIRSSPPFRSSKRCQSFLEYVVRAAIEGRLDHLKERTLGIEVFGRDPDYDTNQDPVVRGTAGEVRKRLAQYYQIAGHERQLRIDLQAGSYLPEFHLPSAEGSIASGEETARSHARRRSLWLALAVTAAMVLAVLAMLPWHTHKPLSVVDQFWAPVVEGTGPVLLCVGQPKVYHFLEPLESEVTRRLPGPGRATAAQAGEKLTVPVGQIIPMWDRYIALGDAICLSDLAGLLTQKGRGYHIRGGGSTSFADLRENPAVLIGAFTNDWTLRLTGELRYSLERGPNLAWPHVSDRLNPARHDWQISGEWPDWKMPLDYAIVSRVLDTATGRVVVTAGGITQYGTAAAGEFLTNPEYLAQAIRQGPADWTHKNIQVVLSTKVIGGTAGAPHVLATYFW